MSLACPLLLLLPLSLPLEARDAEAVKNGEFACSLTCVLLSPVERGTGVRVSGLRAALEPALRLSLSLPDSLRAATSLSPTSLVPCLRQAPAATADQVLLSVPLSLSLQESVEGKREQGRGRKDTLEMTVVCMQSAGKGKREGGGEGQGKRTTTS